MTVTEGVATIGEIRQVALTSLGAKSAKKKIGHKLRHTVDRNACRVTPLMWLPIDSTTPGTQRKICPTCRIHHPVKSLHIWIGPNGEAMVSQGVLDLLKRAGMDGYLLDGATNDPPPLRIGSTREQVDNENRTKRLVLGADGNYIPVK